MNRFLKALSMGAGVAAMLGTSAMAATRKSEPIEIPFDFAVRGQHLPAGTYRVQRDGSDRFAALVNVKTGKRVKVMRSAGSESQKTKLVFEHETGGYVLRKLS